MAATLLTGPGALPGVASPGVSDRPSPLQRPSGWPGGAPHGCAATWSPTTSSTRSSTRTRPTCWPSPGRRPNPWSPGSAGCGPPARTPWAPPLPAEGDPVGLGGPAAFNAAALEAGEAVVALDAASFALHGLVPNRVGAAVDVVGHGRRAPPAARRGRGGPCPALGAAGGGGRAGRARRGPLAARGRRPADEPPPPAPRWPRRRACRRAAWSSPPGACRPSRSSSSPWRTTGVR